MAICTGCRCSDMHACVDKDTHTPCRWLVVNRKISKGVCSSCVAHLERWNNGDYSYTMLVAKVTKEGKTQSVYIEANDVFSFPTLCSIVGAKYLVECVAMSDAEFEALPQFN